MPLIMVSVAPIHVLSEAGAQVNATNKPSGYLTSTAQLSEGDQVSVKLTGLPYTATVYIDVLDIGLSGAAAKACSRDT